MTQPVGGPSQSIDFQQLQKVVRLVDGEPTSQSTPFKSVDVATLGKASGDQDVIVMKPDVFSSISQSEMPQRTAELAKSLESSGVRVGGSLESIGGVEARVSSAEADKLKSEGYMLYDNSSRSLVPGFPLGKVMLDDPTQMPKVDPLALTRTDEVQQAGFTGKGQVVAVIDSGFQHPGTNLVAFKDFVDSKSTPSDPVGHGTHVAGDVLQMAPDAGIVSVRVMNGDGQGRPSDIIRGVQWAIQNKDKYGITAINLSLGGAPSGFPSSADPVDRVVETAIKRGITVVAAAGNSGPEAHTIGSPGDDPLDISVGSALNRTTVSDFSSRGPTDGGDSKPDITAPGEFIVSWTVPGSQMDQMGHVVEKLRHMTDAELQKLLKAKPQLIEALKLPADILSRSPQERLDILHKALPPVFMPDNDHIAAPGTSFASPIVAGIVADLRQADPKAGPQRVKDVLTGTASKMDAQFGPNDDGAGFVDAAKALAAARARANA